MLMKNHCHAMHYSCSSTGIQLNGKFDHQTVTVIYKTIHCAYPPHLSIYSIFQHNKCTYDMHFFCAILKFIINVTTLGYTYAPITCN